MSLPASWVESLFTRLAVRYGAAWMNIWNGVDIELVKADWAHELSYFQQQPEAIKHALENLPPDRPPTVGQFRDLCKRAPERKLPELPPPKLTPQQAAEITAKLGEVAQHIGQPIGREWAAPLADRVRNGHGVSIAVKEMIAETLNRESAELPPGHFTPPPDEALPPAMRLATKNGETL